MGIYSRSSGSSAFQRKNGAFGSITVGKNCRRISFAAIISTRTARVRAVSTVTARFRFLVPRPKSATVMLVYRRANSVAATPIASMMTVSAVEEMGRPMLSQIAAIKFHKAMIRMVPARTLMVSSCFTFARCRSVISENCRITPVF